MFWSMSIYEWNQFFDVYDLKLGSTCIWWNMLLYLPRTKPFFGWPRHRKAALLSATSSSSSESSCLKALWDLLTPLLSRFNYSFWKLAGALRGFETRGSGGDEGLDPRSLSLFLLQNLAGNSLPLALSNVICFDHVHSYQVCCWLKRQPSDTWSDSLHDSFVFSLITRYFNRIFPFVD